MPSLSQHVGQSVLQPISPRHQHYTPPVLILAVMFFLASVEGQDFPEFQPVRGVQGCPAAGGERPRRAKASGVEGVSLASRLRGRWREQGGDGTDGGYVIR